MLQTYINLVSTPILLFIGLGTLGILLITRQAKLTGLFTVAVFDAVITTLSGLVAVISMLRTVNFCGVTDILLKNATLFLSFVNGLVSTVSWNYQCWDKIKSNKSTLKRHKQNILSILPQLSVFSLFFLAVFTLTPQKETKQNTENQSHFFPNTMFSYSYSEICEHNDDYNNSYYLSMFNKFLKDSNQSKGELLIFNADNRSNRRNMSHTNRNEEIVKNIYRLVEEEIADTNNYNHMQSILQTQVETLTRTFNDSEVRFNEIMETMNGSHNEEIYFDTSSYNSNHTFDKHIDRNANNNKFNLYYPKGNVTLNGYPLNDSVQNIPEDNDVQCLAKCFIEIPDQKMYFLCFTLTCYLAPAFGAVILYYKATMEAMRDTDDNTKTTNKTLIESAKWAMILPLLLQTPGLVCLFLETMMCSALPQWLSPILLAINQVQSVLKNVQNILVMKKCMSNQVHPLIEDGSPDETEPQSVIPDVLQENIDLIDDIKK